MVHMAAMGLLTSVVAPGVVLLTRDRIGWHALTPPAWLILPVFVLLHGVVTVSMVVRAWPIADDMAMHSLLFAGAIGFWLPVLTDRISPAGRCLYLFIAAPALDLAAVYAVVFGDPSGGLAMIVAMLPIGLVAVAITWRWVVEEERCANREGGMSRGQAGADDLRCRG